MIHQITWERSDVQAGMGVRLDCGPSLTIVHCHRWRGAELGDDPIYGFVSNAFQLVFPDGVERGATADEMVDYLNENKATPMGVSSIGLPK